MPFVTATVVPTSQPGKWSVSDKGDRVA